MNNTKDKSFEELIAEAPHSYPITDMEIAIITKVFTLSRAIHNGVIADDKGRYHRITESGLDFFVELHNFLVDIIKEDSEAIRKMDYVIDLINNVEQVNKAAHTVGKGGAVNNLRSVNCATK